MPEFTAFDPATRLILYSGTTGLVSALPHDAFEGLAADPATHRVRADLSGVEPKPALGATVAPLSINAGESVTVTVAEPVSVTVDGEPIGTIDFADTIEFPSPGTYALTLTPISGLAIPQTETVTVT